MKQCVVVIEGFSFSARAANPLYLPTMAGATSVHTAQQYVHKIPLSVKNELTNSKMSSPVVVVANSQQNSLTKYH